tara:strand:- start:123 stop:1385 length:1263 start_codon:yes stop_codon:yes gene_type:complete
MKKLVAVLLVIPMVVMGQDAPFECDNNYGECGTPEMSGGGQGGGGSILIANTDLGDTYQTADDYDDDGVEDSYDNCPRKPNREQFDSDGDGVGDLCDNCRNTHNLNQWDLDGDGRGDLCDEDLDDDGVANVIDNCLRVFNTGQDDVDEDGEGDACDRDIDNDGLDNLNDPCPMIGGSPGQEDLDLCAPDLDGDGVQEYGFQSDNCPNVHNPDQYDVDLDGKGDACDPDIDNDGVLNNVDNCPDVFNHEQEDLDRDGRGDDSCDDNFCYVVFGDEENCLDPNTEPRIYSPSVHLNTGETVILRMFSNKPEQNISFTWSVRERMSGSRDTVKNSIGDTSDYSVYEYKVDSRPTFTPHYPGKYILVVAADFGNGTTAQHEVELSVGGVAIPDESSGCSVSPMSTSQSGIFVFLLAFLGLRRRQ